MLTEQVVISAIEILEDGQIQIRRSRRVFDGAEMLAEQYHRHVLAPGDNVSTENSRVQAVCSILWTPTVVAEFKQKREERQRV